MRGSAIFRHASAAALLLSCLLVSSLPLAAQAQRRPMRFEDLMKMRRLGGIDVSPDGRWVLFTVTDVDLERNTRTPHPVSYTHLDVYKRQGETMAFLQVLCDYAAIAIQNVRAVERIQELTITDDLTGLFNSRHLFSVTEIELERSRRFNLPFSLIFIDLDHFKRVNDVHGHLAGSRLLAEIAKTIKQSVRGIDSAFRYGGDEFIVLLPQTGKDAALEVTQRLLHALRDTRYLSSEGIELRIMASFGIASYPEDGSSTQAIIGAADEMMYLVKNSSRGNIAVAQRGFIKA